MTPEPVLDAFISYSPSDRLLAVRIARALSEGGIGVWFDGWELVPGASWQAAVSSAIDAAPVVLMLIGSELEKSQELELGMAIRDPAGLGRLIVVTLPGLRTIPEQLRAAPAFHLSGIEGGELRKLIRAVKSRMLDSPRTLPRGEIDILRLEESVEAFISRGDTYRSIGATGDALLSYRNAIKLIKARPASEPSYLDQRQRRLEMAPILSRIAAVHAMNGDLRRALRTYDESASIFGALVGPTAPDTLDAVANSAVVAAALGDFDGARKRQQRVYATRRDRHGVKHPGTISAASRLADTLFAQGHHARAIELYRAVMKSMAESLGKQHPDTLAVKNNLAAALFAAGDVSAAVVLQHEVYEARQHLSGPRSRETLISGANLARSLRGLGQVAQAELLLDDIASAGAKANAGESSDDGREAQFIGAVMEDLGELERAKDLYERAIQSELLAYGAYSLDTARTAQALASILVSQQQYEPARGLFRLALDARTGLLGPTHPDTLTALGPSKSLVQG